MRTHRIIFWTTLSLFIVFTPIVVNLNINADVKNILIGIICSSLVSAIVELPNLLNYKYTIKNNLYNSLLLAKLFSLQYNHNITDKLKEESLNFTQFGVYYLNNISNYLNSFNQIDETIFTIFNPNKNELLNSKKGFYNLYSCIFTESFSVEIVKNRIKLNQCTINDLDEQLKAIKNLNNKLIEKIDFTAEKLLSKKQLKYFKDNSIKIEEVLKNEVNN